MKYFRRLDKKSSKTATYTCMSRAASYLEKNPRYKSDDYIAVKLLPKFIKFLIKNNILSLKGRISPKGIYPYVIARTKYIDHIFRESIDKSVEQVLIMGAGFDSRGVRFSGLSGNIKVFETDINYTTEAKLKQYKKRRIHKPENNIIIPVDFEKEDPRTKLTEYGFGKNKKTLFILEGLIMYLSEDTVRETFEFIHEYSGPDSEVVFDYLNASVLRLENRYYGESDIYRRVTKDNERWLFGIEDGQIDNFLKSLNFDRIEYFDSTALENKYFKVESGKIIAKINGTHCLVLAKENGK